MNKNIDYLFFLLIFLLLNSCSFDDKSGIWNSIEKEKKRIEQLRSAQDREKNVIKIISSEVTYKKEIKPVKNTLLSKPIKNLNWTTSDFNLQNSVGNIYLPGINNIFLSKKIGKKVFMWSKLTSSPLIYDDYIITVDDRGIIYKIDKKGKKIWKTNIYRNIYKKIYKDLAFSIYKNKIYIIDNIGFIYAINYETGNLIWIKDHGIPFQSQIKILDNKIFVINKQNRILCFETEKGSKLWDIRSVSSFIKSQTPQSLALSRDKSLIVLTSFGDLIKIEPNTGAIFWSLSVLKSSFAHSDDFFKSSSLVIKDEDIIFSTSSSLFSINLHQGFMNWKISTGLTNTPIIDEKNVFVITKNGYLINIDRKLGNIIWSTNILTSSSTSFLNFLKEGSTTLRANVTGSVMGSGKIYSLTSNGWLIVCSAVTGIVESAEKLANEFFISPIISDGSLYLLSSKPKLFGLDLTKKRKLFTFR